jgi:hypothetical protein
MSRLPKKQMSLRWSPLTIARMKKLGEMWDVSDTAVAERAILELAERHGINITRADIEQKLKEEDGAS